MYAFLLSLWLGVLGVDRFYVGDFVMGVCKLSLFVAAQIGTFLFWYFWLSNSNIHDPLDCIIQYCGECTIVAVTGVFILILSGVCNLVAIFGCNFGVLVWWV